MRVIASGNLTVELIRAQRFEVAHRLHSMNQRPEPLHECNKHACDDRQHRIDRVELSPQTMESDPWAMPTERTNDAAVLTKITEPTARQEEVEPQPRRLSPVMGSPALAGLGAAWVVPGTLLDVVA